jgi:hypothetical protein
MAATTTPDQISIDPTVARVAIDDLTGQAEYFPSLQASFWPYRWRVKGKIKYIQKPA